ERRPWWASRRLWSACSRRTGKGTLRRIPGPRRRDSASRRSSRTTRAPPWGPSGGSERVAAPKLIDTTYDGPQRIDRYDLVAEIASGGMATVYLGNLSGVGGFRRFVAIKRLHPHLAKEQEFVEMFLDEARLAAGIHHQHVVPILEVGMSDSGFYLVMEYIEGDTLARIVARALSTGTSVPQNVLL